MHVPLLDLKAQYAALRHEIELALLRVAESQHFILGPEVEKLEQMLVSYLGCKHAIGVSSGTDALLMALMAIDLQPGDEVIVPTYSFFATAGAVARLHAVPVFVDVHTETYNIDPSRIEEKITSRTKAVIPVHLFGQSADMDPILQVARKHGLKVIEDAAQAIGAQYRNGKSAGTMGDIGCFSFFPSKNLGCFGDGGLVTTDDDGLAEKLRILRVHGSQPKYYHKIVGGNFRIDAIQAAVLIVKLPHLDQWSAKRRENAALYTRLLDGVKDVCNPLAVFDQAGVRNAHIYNQYVIRVGNRDGLRKHLAQKGVGSEVYYPVPFHRQECFKYLNAKDGDFPVANELAATSVALPIYPELSPEQIEFVVHAVRDFY